MNGIMPGTQWVPSTCLLHLTILRVADRWSNPFECCIWTQKDLALVLKYSALPYYSLVSHL